MARNVKSNLLREDKRNTFKWLFPSTGSMTLMKMRIRVAKRRVFHREMSSVARFHTPALAPHCKEVHVAWRGLEQALEPVAV